MSVQATTWVIQHSKHKGANLLVLLMIANHAHADGTGAYPSIPTLAAECRMSERQVRRIIEKLAASGELAVEPDAGPRGANLYSLPKMSASEPDKMSGRAKATGQDVRKRTGQDVRKELPLPDISESSSGHFAPALPDIAMSPKLKEPSVKPSGGEGAHAPPPAEQAPPPRQDDPFGQTKHARRLPTETLPDHWRSYCVQKRPDLDPEAVWENFRDYWLAAPGQKGRKQNWTATWQRWVREQRGLVALPPARASPLPEGVKLKQAQINWLRAQGLDDLRIRIQQNNSMATPDQYRQLVEQGMPG